MKRGKLPARRVVFGALAILAIFAVGFVTALKLRANVGPSPQKLTVVTDASHATFGYLVPAGLAGWQMSNKPAVFDKTKGVVSYQIHDSVDNTDVTISQQPMPAALKSQNSPQFNQFIVNSNVVMSEAVGSGKLYFRAQQTVGGTASGAVSVIYATPSVLIFGAAGSPLSYTTWARLMASMKLK